ncbi:MAG: AAA family ATPase [Atopobiaceae bacterium]|nr:AAA family ATPase [Atopobiaceae bacterium]
MGMYVNPGNEGFAGIIAGTYVDKTGLIGLVNRVIGTPDKLVAITRPRRFGKTFAAESLVAYYSCGCDSRALFDGLDICRDPSFDEHLNAYNVVHLDMTEFRGVLDVAEAVKEVLLDDLEGVCPDAVARRVGRVNELTATLADAVDATGRRFVFVIDEWDAPLRERRSKASQEAWVYFLRLLFKNATFTAKAVAACYMTGILPIVRYGTQSALSDFNEYTFLRPYAYAPYAGFTEEETKLMAARSGMDMAELKRWYDGYELHYFDEEANRHVALRCYAPYSVAKACANHEIARYWASSEAFRSLRLYIDLDFDGLQQSIMQALGGASVAVRVGKFENDIHEVSSRDDALTLLCHLGYLAYDAEAGTARVPNEEVRAELRDAVSESRHAEVARIVRESDALLRATWDMDEEAVAAAVAAAHDGGCAHQFYSDEQALRAVVRSAYIAAADHYAEVQEFPSGRGVADIAYVPRRGDPSPALLVELKWNRRPTAALEQVLQRDYARALRDWGGPVLLVDVTYDPKTREHACRIKEA